MVGDEQRMFHRWPARAESTMCALLLVFFETSMDNRNMRETIRATIIALGCLAALLTLAHPVHGLEDPQPSRNPAIVKDQLRQAAALCKRTIREVQALPADDSSPVDPQVHKRARETYILLRAGWWGLSLAQQRETSYKDPMLDL